MATEINGRTQKRLSLTADTHYKILLPDVDRLSIAKMTTGGNVYYAKNHEMDDTDDLLSNYLNDNIPSVDVVIGRAVGNLVTYVYVIADTDCEIQWDHVSA